MVGTEPGFHVSRELPESHVTNDGVMTWSSVEWPHGIDSAVLSNFRDTYVHLLSTPKGYEGKCHYR